MATRTCNKCGYEGDLTDFPVGKSCLYGRRPLCKSCHNEASLTGTARDGHLRRQYGITHEEYQNMHEAQEGACGICAKKLDRLCVDHDHDTGTIRGLLCRQCNSAIGMLQDDVTLVKRAVEYLENK